MESRSLAVLDDDARGAIAAVLWRWGAAHPEPDAPVLELADGSQLTARTIAASVQVPRSSQGEFIFELFALGLADERRDNDLDRLLAVFRADTERWFGQRGHLPDEPEAD